MFRCQLLVPGRVLNMTWYENCRCNMKFFFFNDDFLQPQIIKPLGLLWFGGVKKNFPPLVPTVSPRPLGSSRRPLAIQLHLGVSCNNVTRHRGIQKRLFSRNIFWVNAIYFTENLVGDIMICWNTGDPVCWTLGYVNSYEFYLGKL